MAVGRATADAAFEDYDLDDLLAVRTGDSATHGHDGREPSGSQLDQLREYATLLREFFADVLQGDHSVFPQLEARIARRRWGSRL